MRLDRDLRDRHIRVGEHIRQRHPSTMIEASVRIINDLKSALSQARGRLFGNIWRTLYTVTKLIHRFAEAIKIMNGVGAACGGNRYLRGLPMGRDHQYCGRFLQRSTIVAQKLSSRAILQQYHRRPVRNEKTWRAVHAVDPSDRFSGPRSSRQRLSTVHIIVSSMKSGGWRAVSGLIECDAGWLRVAAHRLAYQR